jgi:hypothetical protein
MAGEDAAAAARRPPKEEEEDDDDEFDNVPLALSRAKKVCLPLPQISAFRSVAWRASQCERR